MYEISKPFTASLFPGFPSTYVAGPLQKLLLHPCQILQNALLLDDLTPPWPGDYFEEFEQHRTEVLFDHSMFIVQYFRNTSYFL